jgi:hypothetical protein
VGGECIGYGKLDVLHGAVCGLIRAVSRDRIMYSVYYPLEDNRDGKRLLKEVEASGWSTKEELEGYIGTQRGCWGLMLLFLVIQAVTEQQIGSLTRSRVGFPCLI